MHDKSKRRAELAARRAIAFGAFPDAGERLAAHFPFPVFKNAIVAGYMPFRTEIAPLPLLRQLARQGANLVMPRINSPSHLLGGVGVGGSLGDTYTADLTTTAPHPPAPSPQGGRGEALMVRSFNLKIQSSIAQSKSPSPQVGRGDALAFHLCDIDDQGHFQKNKWGLLEPHPDLPTATPTLLLVPLLGFDRQGNRLGYGKGYYDATIQALKSQGSITTIGLAFAEQEVSEIPTQPHDQRLDWIITQNEAYRVPS